jgi:hypothetical protein
MANGGGDGNSDDDEVTVFGKASRNSSEYVKKTAEKGESTMVTLRCLGLTANQNR